MTVGRPRVGGNTGGTTRTYRGRLNYDCAKCGARRGARCIIWRKLADNTPFQVGYCKVLHKERGPGA
jgi:hypothetical protein